MTSVTISVVPGQQPTLTAEFLAGMWETFDPTTALVDYDVTSLPQLPATSGEVGGKFRVQNATWTTSGDEFASRSMSNVDITMTADYTPALSHSSPNGVGQYICTNRAVSMTYTELSNVTGASDALSHALGTPGSTSTVSGGDGCHILTVNTTPGQAFSVIMPVAKQRELSELSDSEGVIAVSRTIEPGFVGLQNGTSGLETNVNDSGNTVAATGDVENTPSELHFYRNQGMGNACFQQYQQCNPSWSFTPETHP